MKYFIIILMACTFCFSETTDVIQNIKEQGVLSATKDQMISQLNSNQFLMGGLILGALASIGIYLRRFPLFIWERFSRIIKFSVFVDENDRFYIYLNRWLKMNHSNKLRNAQINLKESNRRSNEPDSEGVDVIGKAEKKVVKELRYFLTNKSDTFLIWYKRRPIIISKNQDKLEAAKDLDSFLFNNYSISGLFAKKQIHSLIEDILTYADKQKEVDPSFDIWMAVWGNQWKYVSSKIGRSADSVTLHPEIKNRIFSSIDLFFKSEKWYLDRGIPYNLSFMIHGPPGNGKSSIINSIANKYSLGIFYLNLSQENLDDNMMMNLFSEVTKDSVLVIEDMDSIFDGRKNISKSKITFSGFINCLDGIISSHKLITIMTSNHLDKMDEALIRPGRIDEMVEIGYPRKEEIKEYFTNFFKEGIDIESEIKQTPMAKIQEICMNNRNNPELARYEILKEVEYKQSSMQLKELTT